MNRTYSRLVSEDRLGESGTLLDGVFVHSFFNTRDLEDVGE